MDSWISFGSGSSSVIRSQLNEKAPIESPSFTGTVTLPTDLTGIPKVTAGVISIGEPGTDYATPLTPQPVDNSYSGATIIGTVGENVVAGDLCYLKSDGKYWKAKADANATMPAVAMAITSITANSTGHLLLAGYFRDDDGWGGALTVGAQIWVSAATSGLATQSQPAVATNLVQNIGYAVAARIVFFDPVRTLIEVSA